MKTKDIAVVTGIGIGTLVLGTGLYLLLKKPAAAPEITVLSVTPTATAVAAGGYAEVTIQWQNVGTVAAQPKFRLDLRRSGFTTWTEGVWVTADSIDPDATSQVKASCYIPGDWGPMTIDAKVMLKGEEAPVWQQSDVFRISELISVVTIVSVVPVSVEVSAGSYAQVTVTYRNDGEINVTPRFRLDLKQPGIAFWNEGVWVTGPSASPGQTKTVTARCTVPADWGPAIWIDAKLMLEGVEPPVWAQNNSFYIPSEEEIVTILSVVPVSNLVYPGGYAEVDIKWRNDGQIQASPQFRLDLRQSGIAYWNEGNWKTSIGNPGQTVTVRGSIMVPADWGANNYIDAKVMELGMTSAIWIQEDVFWIPPEELGFVLHSVTPQSLEVPAGQTARVSIDWENVTSVTMTQRFRLDLRRSGAFATWTEGPWVLASAAPWQRLTTIATCVIPANWGACMMVDMKLMRAGLEAPIWIKGDILHVI